MVDRVNLASCTGFQWDDGNAGKNFVEHDVADSEAEQAFFSQPRIMRRDSEHSQNEPRYYLLGATDSGRKLFVSFTIRGDLIRMISARDMTRKELKIYAGS